MVQITIDLVRRKAEHNAGSLDDLEELSLHQLNLDGINGVLGNTTRKLRILYLQNNFIPRLENLHKLTRLEYLNVALNSIARVEGLESCESLRKLDLTVNFIDSPTLLESLRALAACESLREVYLTGNPCTTFDGYRALVIALVPQLTKLDGEEISRSERIVARQRLPALLASLEEDAARKQLPRDGSVAEVKGDDERKGEEYTRETRMAMLREIEEEVRGHPGKRGRTPLPQLARAARATCGRA
jgi:protein TilB